MRLALECWHPVGRWLERKRRKMVDTRYPVEVFWVEEDNVWFAISPVLGPSVSAYGDTAEEAVAEFEVVRDLALESYAERGMDPPRAMLSGKLSLRLPRSLHAQLSRLAETEEVSLNLLLVSLLAERAGRRQQA